jgi:hypothetical protein
MERERGISGSFRDPERGDIFMVASDAGSAFDAAVMGFLLRWTQRYPHELSRRVLNRVDLVPGRAFALIVNGTPLITRLPGREHADWDFVSWADGSSPPMERDHPISLDGRIRWSPSFEEQRASETWHHPVHDWIFIVRRFLNADSRHIALFESTFNRTGESSRPNDHSNVVKYQGQVMHLVTATSTNDEIDRAWAAAQGYSAGERIGYLTELPLGEQLVEGDEVADDLLHLLARRVQGIGFEAFDGSGVLIWGIGAESWSWIDGEGL